MRALAEPTRPFCERIRNYWRFRFLTNLHSERVATRGAREGPRAGPQLTDRGKAAGSSTRQ